MTLARSAGGTGLSAMSTMAMRMSPKSEPGDPGDLMWLSLSDEQREEHGATRVD